MPNIHSGSGNGQPWVTQPADEHASKRALRPSCFTLTDEVTGLVSESSGVQHGRKLGPMRLEDDDQG